MDKLFVDTNIVLDLLLQRQPFYNSAAELFTLADRGGVKLFVSSLTFNDLDYILSKQFDRSESRRILSKLKLLVNVLSVGDKIISLSLSSDFSDFEDAIQYFTATEHNIHLLITRNLKDFKKAVITVMTAETYLKQRK